jgi:hypothetical protein
MLPFATIWMNLEVITIYEINQTQKDKYCLISFIYRIYKIELKETEKSMVSRSGGR